MGDRANEEISGDQPSARPLPGKGDNKHAIIFATFAESDEQLSHAIILAESIRTFAGRFRESPVWIFVPQGIDQHLDECASSIRDVNAKVVETQAPAEALWFYYARKVFAAAQAEAQAEDHAKILVWMDEDTVVLQEPKGFLLDDDKLLAYRPVMHQNIGSLYADPPDAFWSRIYEKLSVPESAIFPMVTPADNKTLRPYFNAGLLAVRPERGILRRWADCFPVLYADPTLAEMCRQDFYKRIFLHQTALAGAILTALKAKEMVELSRQYNYPIFFREMFGAEREFHSVHDVVTLRYDVYFRDPAPDWREKLEGPEDVITWLGQRLGKERK